VKRSSATSSTVKANVSRPPALGWVTTNALPELVKARFPNADPSAQEVLIRGLVERPIGEIIDVRRTIEVSGNGYDAACVENLDGQVEAIHEHEDAEAHKIQLGPVRRSMAEIRRDMASLFMWAIKAPGDRFVAYKAK
jgi:hypothetical protein